MDQPQDINSELSLNSYGQLIHLNTIQHQHQPTIKYYPNLISHARLKGSNHQDKKEMLREYNYSIWRWININYGL